MESTDRKVPVLTLYKRMGLSYNAGALLTQIQYWYPRRDPNKGFYKSFPQWFDELYLSESEIRTARTQLKKFGIIDYHVGSHPYYGQVTYYELHQDVLDKLIKMQRAELKAQQKGQMPLQYSQPKPPTVIKLEDLILPACLASYDAEQIMAKLSLLSTPPKQAPSAAQLVLDALAAYAAELRYRDDKIRKPLDSLVFMIDRFNSHELRTDGANNVRQQRQRLAASKATPPQHKNSPKPKTPPPMLDLKQALRGRAH